MNNVTRADVEALRRAARRIASISEEYRDEYTAMYRVIHEKLKAAWMGDDSDSFQENVDSIKYKFTNMYDIMNSYVQFLLDTASKYEEQIRMMEEAANQIQF